MELILGGPGCGKTTALLEIVMQALKSGVEPNRIGYIAFTRKAATEARERAMTKFKFSKDDLPYFRTIHSLAFVMANIQPQEVMGKEEWREFGSWMNIIVNKSDYDEDGTPLDFATDERALTAHALSRLKCKTLKETCYELFVDFNRAEHLAKQFDHFKKYKRKLDYTDFLDVFLARAEPPELDLLIVDEGQDLSALQWQVVRKVASSAARVVVGGDDDQAIFEWAGADVPYFCGIDAPTTVLPKSYRLPSKIHALTKNIAKRIETRFEKDFSPARDGGVVERIRKLEYLDIGKGEWMILARNKYLLGHPTTYLRRNGLPYLTNGKASTDTRSCRALIGWENMRKGNVITGEHANTVKGKLHPDLSTKEHKFDPREEVSMQLFGQSLGLLSTPDWMRSLVMPDSEREYYRAIKRRGESLIDRPRITMSTIHGVKGGEAENVALVTDMADSCYRSMARNPSGESRVFYVGASRAKERLFILDPITAKHYRMPRDGI